jgi:quercetin dioxygenase-like cupin family protein
MIKGKMKVLVDDEMKVVEAPFIIVSPPGTKRIAEALEDTTWITIHGTNETDLDKIEQHFIAEDMQEYLDFDKQLLLPLG